MDDKLFALSLMKQSPKCYRLLRKVFALASRRTLVDLLNKLPFVCGINPQIIKALRGCVEKMDPLDRTCSLIFDEMSLQPGLSYSRKTDAILGFEDVGTERRAKFADHATVFMVRGIRKKMEAAFMFLFYGRGNELF